MTKAAPVLRTFALAIALLVVAEVVSATESRVSAQEGQPGSGLRVAILGDSYISGEGTGDFIDGTDSSSNQCHRSVRSWAYMTALVLADGDTGDIEFFACSGSDIDDMWNRNGDSHGNENAQLDAFESAHRQDPFDVVFLSIGGNDAGFGELAFECVTRRCTDNARYVSDMDTELTPLVMQVLQRLRSIAGRHTPIFHVGYPDPLAPAGTCLGLLGVSESEQEWVSSVFIATLNAQLERAAQQAGVNFVDTSSWFEGHSICAPSGAESFANGLRIFSQSDSLHPNRAGYREMQLRFATRYMSGGELTTITNPVPLDNGVRFSLECGGEPATFLGTRGNDSIKGTAGPDVIASLDGRDVVRGRGGNDLICTGPGNDWILAGPGDDRVWAGTGSDNVGAGRGEDSVHANSGDDTVRGGVGDDRIWTGRGSDLVFGGPGDDQLWGTPGVDRLAGGTGSDTCHWGAQRRAVRVC